ncbi:Scarecrow-like protein 9 [Linum perenne]
MDPRLSRFSSSNNGEQQPLVSVLSNPNFPAQRNFNGFSYIPSSDPTLIPNETLNSTVARQEQEEYPEDCDFSDTVLSYISQILMEEEMEDKTCMLQDSLDLQAAEKSFYDVLGKKYPPSPEPSTHLYNPSHVLGINNNGFSYLDGNSNNATWNDYDPFQFSQSSYTSSNNSVGTSNDGFVDSPSSTFKFLSDFGSESQSISQFNKGVEEANKFLPNGNNLFINIESNRFLYQQVRNRQAMMIKPENNGIVVKESLASVSRGRKNLLIREELPIEEGRSSKVLAVHKDSNLPPDVFDSVLLCSVGKGKEDLTALIESLKSASIRDTQNGTLKTFRHGKGRGKKGAVKKEVVDLRTLLITCAQAVAADDGTSASGLLKQIRLHSSPFGDANQRLANCFADGLEARIAGTGSQIYKGLVNKKICAADVLKAYHLYLAACPFRKLSNFVSNKTIRTMSGDAMKVHVIDFGVLYGFQWPTLIQRMSWRPGGPPKLRITGIDFPQPGFRPAERVEETGRRLAAYAEKFKVPFEYNAIAKKWENVQLEDLKIERDEFVVVNCLYRAKNLLDETVCVDSPRKIVLGLIKKIDPQLFIHGVINGAFNAPFFVTRFREALFHFSAMFDMLETVVPREDQERMLIEKEIFGREALNVIACEGWERVERPETYKQWQVRCLRAGFEQLAWDKETVKEANKKVKEMYHKDFLIDEDSKWLLQGWKGRIIFALSAWKPC